MASFLPSRLLGHIDGNFFVFDPRSRNVSQFDIISYDRDRGDEVDPYKCGIEGVDWDVTVSPAKINDIKRLMVNGGIQYLWADCVCINQVDIKQKSAEIATMSEYYRSAHVCHILIDMPEVWFPQDIVDNLKFLDHVLSHMRGAELASEAIGLTENVNNRLSMWANKEWNFRVDKPTVISAAIDLGVLNCYATCINHVRSLFDNLYFTRMWTFQEMILGKNIIMWGINKEKISCIRELHIWMDLATDAKDKAHKLFDWIYDSRVLRTASVNAILRAIEEDNRSLEVLQLQVRGIDCARSDIINGGPSWWFENYKGISNIFSAVSITPRICKHNADIFRGLLGIFSGLFTAEEIEEHMSGNDIEKVSFNFFKQLSSKTGFAWTKLAISSGARGEWDWIPVVENHDGIMTTECFAGVVNLGRLKQNGRAKATAMTGITGTPRNYMKITLKESNGGFQFIFKGCNCGKSVKTGVSGNEPIPTYDQPINVIKDDTGRILVQCATILGSLMDPNLDTDELIQYRQRLLNTLRPDWKITDPNAKPIGWVNRCVSGTFWENPHPFLLRPHNLSMNYNMIDITGCESRLANESTDKISCEVRVNCGCTITAPFSLIFEAIMAVQGSFLGNITATLDDNERIILKDGVGLVQVQVGDVGRTFHLVAFGGEVDSHKSYASSCRSTKVNKAVLPKRQWPCGRALIRQEFTHDMTNMMREYGYVPTGGSGNLLISRNHPLDQYKIVGVCIDEFIQHKNAGKSVTIQ